MNDKPVAAGTRVFEPRDIELRDIPGQSQLFLDFLYSPEKTARYYPNSAMGLSDFAESALKSYQTDRQQLANALTSLNREYGSGERTFRNIERLRQEDCVAVLTGQQAGLFTGPAYTIHKAVSAIVLAEELTREGVNAVPVFWIASEDHDIEEVNAAWSIDGDGELIRNSYSGTVGDGDVPTDSIAFSGSITALREDFESSLQGGNYDDEVARILDLAYIEGESFAGAFGKALAALFAERGLILVSPMDREIRRLAAPFAAEIVKRAGSIRARLLSQSSALESAGYHSQVRVTEDFFPFFLIDGEEKRIALMMDETGTRVSARDGSVGISEEELLKKLEENPGCLSPSALIRPLIQDHLFPTACYLGGGAEIAYFAQNSVVYEELGRPVTPIRHRASFTVVEPRNRRTIEKYDLRLEQVFEGYEALRTEVAGRHLFPEMTELFRSTRESVESAVDALQDALERSEPTLADSLSKRRKKMLWQLETLERKFLRSESARDETAERRLRFLSNGLWPNGGLQERTLNIFQFIDTYGLRFIDWLIESADVDQHYHRFLYL